MFTKIVDGASKQGHTILKFLRRLLESDKISNFAGVCFRPETRRAKRLHFIF